MLTTLKKSIVGPLLGAGIVLSASVAGASENNQDWNDCTKGEDKNRIVQACTATIKTGGLDKGQLATAYNKRAHAYYSKALAYKREGNDFYIAVASDEDFDKSVADFTKASELNPKEANNYYGLGSLYEVRKQFKKAVAAYTKAIDLEPSHEHYMSRALLYGKQGKNLEALSDYTFAISVNPNDASAYMLRSTIYKKLGRHDLAKQDLNKYFELDP